MRRIERAHVMSSSFGTMACAMDRHSGLRTGGRSHAASTPETLRSEDIVDMPVDLHLHFRTKSTAQRGKRIAEEAHTPYRRDEHLQNDSNGICTDRLFHGN